MLNLAGGEVDTHTPMGSMVVTVMAVLAEMWLEIKRDRIADSVTNCRTAGKDLGGRRPACTDGPLRNAVLLVESSELATYVAGDIDVSRATLCRRIRELPDLCTWLNFHVGLARRWRHAQKVTPAIEELSFAGAGADCWA